MGLKHLLRTKVLGQEICKKPSQKRLQKLMQKKYNKKMQKKKVK